MDFVACLICECNQTFLISIRCCEAVLFSSTLLWAHCGNGLLPQDPQQGNIRGPGHVHPTADLILRLLSYLSEEFHPAFVVGIKYCPALHEQACSPYSLGCAVLPNKVPLHGFTVRGTALLLLAPAFLRHRYCRKY